MRVLHVLCSVLALAASSASGQPAPADCLRPGGWLRLDASPPRAAPAGEIAAEMARREVVLLGEEHSDPDHHAWQLHTLAALYAHNPRMVIGFEMFPRRAQGVLDRWVAGELSVDEFLRQSNWREVWRYPPELYLPMFQFARLNRIPMLALNVDPKLVAEIGKKGWDGVPSESREGLSRPAPASAAYRHYLFQVWREHERPRGAQDLEPSESSPGFRNFVDAQLTWDRAMAQALAARLARGGVSLAVGILGAGHAREGHGVPHQLHDLGVHSVGVLLPVQATADCKELGARTADAVFGIASGASAAARPRPPRLGVRMEQTAAGVTLVEVLAGSLAERTGLRKGDVIARIAGKPLASSADMVEAVGRQPDGTWLPLQVRRGGQSIEVVLKFPPP